MNYTACMPKNCDHHLSGRLYGLRLLRSWFTQWCLLFWSFLRLGCEVMDPCFIHSNEIDAEIHLKLRWNISKHCFEIGTRSHLWSTVSKRGTHLVDSFFIPNCSCKIEITVPCDMSVTSTSSLVDQSKQYHGLYR